LTTDGDLDILVSNNGRHLNASATTLASPITAEILLIGTKSKSGWRGCAGKNSMREISCSTPEKSGMSYNRAQDPRLHFGLGNAPKWMLSKSFASGMVTKLSNLKRIRLSLSKKAAGWSTIRSRRIETK